MNTRRHPRSLAEAFGPYTDHNLHPMPSERSWRLSDAAIALLCVAVILAVVLGVL